MMCVEYWYVLIAPLVSECVLCVSQTELAYCSSVSRQEGWCCQCEVGRGGGVHLNQLGLRLLVEIGPHLWHLFVCGCV